MLAGIEDTRQLMAIMATETVDAIEAGERNHFIDGRWSPGVGTRFEALDPSNGPVDGDTGSVNGKGWTGRAADRDEVIRACAAACRAFPQWVSVPLEVRVAFCDRFRQLLAERVESLAAIISCEVGKPLWESRLEVASMIAKIPISVAAHAHRTGDSTSTIAEGTVVRRHRAHGALAVFGPYNFPGHLPNGHIVPALIAGNTVVFKPSEHAPRTAIAVIALWQEAGLPPGVINLVQGASETGRLLADCVQSDTPVSHALSGILFTGSHRTGALLHRQMGGQPGKMLALEMGGNNPLVVWETLQLDAAVHHTIVSAFISAGQRCTCARRLIIEDGPRGRMFLERLIAVASRIVVGTWSEEPQPFMGPVVSSTVAKNLLSVQKDLIAKGAISLLLMRSVGEGTGLLSPGILDVTDVLKVPDEEWFGPLLQVIRVRDFAEALKVANTTRYGLAAALISDRSELWQQFQIGVRAGIVNWNRPTTGASSNEPFGGVGDSGNHRPSALYAADYCAYPIASIEGGVLQMPEKLLPGLDFSR